MKYLAAVALTTTACTAQAHEIGSTEQTVLALCIVALCVASFIAGVTLATYARRCKKGNP